MDFFDLVALPNRTSSPKVMPWLKMAAQAPRHIPVLMGKKEEKAKRDALTSLPEPVPEVASAYIPLARLGYMPHMAAS